MRCSRRFLTSVALSLALVTGIALCAQTPEGTVSVNTVSPNFGPTSGGTAVTILGASFVSGATVTFGGNPATDVGFVNANTLTAKTPAHAAGVVDVVVTVPGPISGTLPSGFTYTDSTQPSVTGVSPNSGPPSGGTGVTLTGIYFTGATAVTFGSTPATTFTVNSSTSISCTSPAGSGTVHVTVTTPSGTSAQTTADQFTYTSGPTPPSVTGVSPGSGPQAGGTSVTLTGTSFTGATAVHFGSGLATNVSVASDTSITCTSPAGSGTVHVTVTTSAGTSSQTTADQFTYTGGATPPTVTGVSPNAGPPEGNTSVTITGTDFTGATAVHFGTGLATDVNVGSATSITCKSPAGTGTVDVTVTTPAGTSSVTSADQFTYTSAPQPPAVAGLSPSSGPTAGNTAVTVSGGFFTNATSVVFGDAVAVFAVNSDSSIMAISPAHSAGQVHVRVTTTNGTSAATNADLFTYADATLPAVTGVSPSTGPTAGGTQVTISGSGFTGATAVKFGDSAATFTLNSSSSITATSPARTAGTVDVTVTTPSGTSATSQADKFTYSDGTPSPTVTSISPTTGPTTGGTAVTVHGTNFAGATSVLFGDTASAGFSVIDSATVSATSPAHAEGAVHVRVTTAGGTSPATDGDLFTYTGGGSCTLTCDATVPETGAANVAISFQATATATGCTGSVTYSWTFGDGATSSQQSPSHIYSSSGHYSWSMTAMVGDKICQKYGTILIATPPIITSVSKLSSPFRLKVIGGNFHPSAVIKIDGTAVPATQWKSITKAIAMKGSALKAMCPNGQTVQITVTNTDDGGVSAPYPFTP